MQLARASVTSASIIATKPQGPWSSMSPAFNAAVPVGSVRVSYDLRERGSVRSTQALRTGAVVGAVTGYANLVDAIGAIGALTHLTKGAAALVLRDGDRFYGRRAMVYTLGGWDSAEGRTRYGWHTVNERPGAVDVLGIERLTVDPRLAAYVDGHTIHQFRRV
ncbi:MAG: hypothetical protein H7287_14390 [Thermoleophilia bacterium]|nr:hypothetical protein [Thermoleophilia bacterium]